MPTVSFVVTVYNKAPFLPDVIQALIAQEGDFVPDYVFVNDGSTDASLSILHDCTARLKNVHIIDQANAGVSCATNVGVQAATGDYIKLVDSDDLLAPFATQLLLDTLKQQKVDFIFGTSQEYTDKTQLPFTPPHAPKVSVYQNALETVIQRGFARVSHCLFKRSAFLSFGGCDERIFSQDHSLFYRFAALGPLAQLHHTVCASPQDEPNRIMNNKAQVQHDSCLALAHILTETPSLPPRLRSIGQKKLATRAWRWARKQQGTPLSLPIVLRYVASRLGLRLSDKSLIDLCHIFRHNQPIRRP